MSSDKLEILVLQPSLQLNQLDSNLLEYEALLNCNINGFRENQTAICFPEYWNGLRKEAVSETTYFKSLNFLERIAKEHSSWIIGGSQVVKEIEQLYNRTHLFNSSGKLLGYYDKQNPFGYEKTQGFTKGDKELIWNLSGWKAAIRICSDLWNVNGILKLLETEIDILFCPTLTVVPSIDYTNYGRFMWYNLAVVRAKEAAIIVTVSDMAEQVIREPYYSVGASCLADPSWRFKNSDTVGTNIINTMKNGERGTFLKIVDLEKLHSQREYRKNVGLMEERKRENVEIK
ncbi:MAG: carbon-nitrogen hydrolase family protein [Candidatus Heimdallarchaeota archaeon]|nr:carbon-nitrogen hydrolase family protein [Candidatus Heimdallarchaeota archaeon]